MTTVTIVNYIINDINVITTVIIIKETGLLSKKCQFVSPYALTKNPPYFKRILEYEGVNCRIIFAANLGFADQKLKATLSRKWQNLIFFYI